MGIMSVEEASHALIQAAINAKFDSSETRSRQDLENAARDFVAAEGREFTNKFYSKK